jgi:alanyl-tRNA synthetase
LNAAQGHLIQSVQQVLKANGPTQFTGYHGAVRSTGQVLLLSDGEKEVQRLETNTQGFVIMDSTCFYAESGGQVGDVGILVGPKGQADVLDTTKMNDVHIHHVKVTDGELYANDQIQELVDAVARRNTAAHHSATHLLHSALRKVLGTHVTQAGSLVAPDKLRFDFTHNSPLSEAEIEAIESQVNAEIAKLTVVETNIMTPKEAQAAGALALFGEKYGDQVRVLKMGEYSMELCGGTHVENTGNIRLFKIVHEAGVSSGVRRIEALCADPALRYVMKNVKENQRARQASGIQENWTQYLTSENEPTLVIEKLKEERRQLEKQLQQAKGASVDLSSIMAGATKISIGGTEGHLLIQKVPVDDRQVLSDLTDKAKDKIGTGLIILIGESTTPHPINVAATSNLAGKVHAGKILTEVAKALGGKGGGRPDFAQGAVPSLEKYSELHELVKGLLQ